MPRKRKKVTPAEWALLEALWAAAPLSAREVHEQAKTGQAGSPQTTRTLLDRLLAKGLVERRDAHGIGVFTPRCAREDVIREESRSFLARFFAGRPMLGAAHFIEDESLSEDELRRLRRLLDQRLKAARHDD